MKTRLTLYFITIVLLLTYCSPEKNKKNEKIIIDDQMGAKPAWVASGSRITSNDGEKVITFSGYGDSKYKDTAKETAQLNAATSAATSIKAIVHLQVNTIIKTENNKSYRKISSGLEALSAKNVNVSGMRKIGAWWRKIKKPMYNKGKFIGYSEPFYEYYILYTLPYKIYKDRRNGYLKDLKVSANKAIMDKIEKKLEDLDNK